MSAEPLNGVDLQAVAEIAAGYRREPESGLKPFGASVRWIRGYSTAAQLGRHAGVAGDEPPELAGGGSGPAPEEMLLGAVGQCLIVGIVGSASARGIQISSLEVTATGRANLTAAYGGGGNPGFESIAIDVRLEADADRDGLEELIAHALKLAPIPDTVSRPVPVEARLV